MMRDDIPLSPQQREKFGVNSSALGSGRVTVWYALIRLAGVVAVCLSTVPVWKKD